MGRSGRGGDGARGGGRAVEWGMRKRLEWWVRWGSTVGAVVVLGGMVFCLFAHADLKGARWGVSLHSGALTILRYPWKTEPSVFVMWSGDAIDSPLWLRVDTARVFNLPGGDAAWVSVPLLYLVAPLAATSLSLWRGQRRRTRSLTRGSCYRCGYDLRGMPVKVDGAVVCPECGEPKAG